MNKAFHSSRYILYWEIRTFHYSYLCLIKLLKINDLVNILIFILHYYARFLHNVCSYFVDRISQNTNFCRLTKKMTLKSFILNDLTQKYFVDMFNLNKENEKFNQLVCK